MIRRILGMLLGIIAAALIVEALARLGFPHWAPRTGSLTAFWRHDPLLGWAHIANADGSFNSHGFKSTVKINSKGFRDIERTYEHDGSKYRIAVLGDSMVWGWGVQQEETFTALLERRCRGLEALNFGVSGYGTDQELLLLHQEVFRYHPQLVVAVIMENDFGTNMRQSVFLGYEKPLYQFDGQGGLVLVNVPVPEPSMWVHIAFFPIRHSYVLNQGARALEGFKLFSHASGLNGAQPTIDKNFPANTSEAITAALLLELQKESTKMSAELLLVVADRMDQLGLRLEEFFRSKHVATVNLDRVFPPSEAKDLYLPDGIHWTTLGHERVADQLIEYFRSNKDFLSQVPLLDCLAQGSF
jgi:lysophospholipase L1-like esterase